MYQMKSLQFLIERGDYAYVIAIDAKECKDLYEEGKFNIFQPQKLNYSTRNNEKGGSDRVR